MTTSNTERPLNTQTTERFRAIKAAALAIEGMTLEFSLAVMDALLGFQQSHNINGHLIEFGVYKGRSAAILAGQCQDDERLILVDVADYPERDALRNIRDRVEFFTGSSEKFSAIFPSFKLIRGRCRFVHIDSSHQYRATMQELSLAETLLADGGIVALDDFTNLNYSQILAATYKYLFTTRTQLCMFLVTDAKAYLCKRKDFVFFAGFVLDGILSAMALRDLGNLCLARTDADEEYRPIHLREKQPSETDDYYGRDLYEHYYRGP